MVPLYAPAELRRLEELTHDPTRTPRHPECHRRRPRHARAGGRGARRAGKRRPRVRTSRCGSTPSRGTSVKRVSRRPAGRPDRESPHRHPLPLGRLLAAGRLRLLRARPVRLRQGRDPPAALRRRPVRARPPRLARLAAGGRSRLLLRARPRRHLRRRREVHPRAAARHDRPLVAALLARELLRRHAPVRGLGGFGGVALVAGVRWSFRGKDAGSADSRAIGATEDAASGRAARPGDSAAISPNPPRAACTRCRCERRTTAVGGHSPASPAPR